MKNNRRFSPLTGSAFAGAIAMTPLSVAHSHANGGQHPQQLSIESGDTHEVCLELMPPQRLSYTFTVTGELAFNIHHHVDRKIFYPLTERLSLQASTVFTPESGRHYCLMWTNRSSSAVELSLQQEMPD
jgi:hypothetical protein